MKLRNLFSFLLTSVTAGLAAVLVLVLFKPEILQLLDTEPQLNRPQQVYHPPRVSGPFSYSDAVSTAAPSVVNIFTTKITTELQSLRFNDPVMQHLFGRLLPGMKRQRRESSLGSGVIITADGYLLTNHHVVDGADEIKVVLSNGHSVDVSLIGSDPESDVAVLKIDHEPDLPAIPIGSSGDQQVGDVVLAIGNPFGVGQTVTMGIISATGRSHLGINTFENFIQTDAAINPGNSGGALVNARGELIGINTAIFSKTGGYQGIGFAIPFDLAEGIMRQLIASGRVVRGWLGIEGQDVTEKLAEAFGLSGDKGFLITGVMQDGPASKAGLRPGDVITGIDDSTISNSQELMHAVASKAPGTRFQVDGWRGSKEFSFEAVSGKRPAADN
jgi:serine protease DegS